MPGAAPLLLKISGEALKGEAPGPFDPAVLDRVAGEIVAGTGVRGLAVVVGGGNLVRGADVAGVLAERVTGDYMGMLATLINALALRDALVRAGGRCLLVAPTAVPNVAEAYDRARVLAALGDGVVVVFGGGTGHPFFTTDTTAALRAAEIGAAAVLKGSNVDGVYDRDPRAHRDARRFERLDFDAALRGRYAVMDQTAFALCREQAIPIRVFDMGRPGSVAAALGDDPPGTLVHPTQEDA